MAASPCRASIHIAVHTPAAAEDAPSVSTMLKDGWQIAGYTQAFDNRSTFILFRHPEQAYLVQVPGRLRRDTQATHLLDLLQARVSPRFRPSIPVSRRRPRKLGITAQLDQDQKSKTPAATRA